MRILVEVVGVGTWYVGDSRRLSSSTGAWEMPDKWLSVWYRHYSLMSCCLTTLWTTPLFHISTVYREIIGLVLYSNSLINTGFCLKNNNFRTSLCVLEKKNQIFKWLHKIMYHRMKTSN